MHACHPLHASPCTTELHMTSIWEQWDSDLITNSLLLIKTCRLHPPPSPFLFFSLLSPLSPACFLVLCSPCLPSSSSCRLHPSTPESHHSAVSPLLAAKKGPISSSAESYKLPSFFLCSFPSLFFLLRCTSLRPSLSEASNILPAGLIETLLMFLIFSLSQPALTLIDTKQEQKWERMKMSVCVHTSTCIHMLCLLVPLRFTVRNILLSHSARCYTLPSSWRISLTQKHKRGLTFHLPRWHCCWEVWQ